MTKSIRKTTKQWMKTLDIKCQVLDPDGWDRSSPQAFARSMSQPITKEQFYERMWRSTCLHRHRPGEDRCSCWL